MSQLNLKPAHATVKAYYETLHQFGQLYIDHEGAVRSAFQTLLAKCGQRSDPKLTLVPEYRIKRAKSSVIVDGALVDLYHLPHGYWEAKDERDDLAEEVKRKFDKGYPRDNIIFQAPERAILYQGGTRIFDENISRPEALVSVVNQFFIYKAPQIDEWLKAVNEFSDRVPELSQQVENLIKEERRKNPSFLHAFDDFYHDPSIAKWDIFHYIYAVLHHPEYRERYAANLRRELPRIPFASALNNCHPERSEGPLLSPNCALGIGVPRSARDDKSREVSANSAPALSVVEGSSAVKDVDVFRALAKAGQRLAEIHVHYEEQPEYPLMKREKEGEKLDWRVTKMRLSKDKSTLIYNDFLTLSEIPKETYDYRLGNRSALEWVIDQYQVSTDKRSGITNDPNREDDPQYIVRLIGQVITVSLETVKIVKGLPELRISAAPEG